jgi:hypothetical protein
MPRSRMKSLLIAVVYVSCSMAAPGATTICLIKDNKKSAVVFTTDDGLLTSVKYYVNEWKKDTLRGTCAIIPGQLRNASAWAPWIALVAEGYLDLGNHSMNHPAGGIVNETWAQLEPEVNGAKDAIEANVPGYKVVTFLCPEGAYNDLAIQKIMERHAANRVIDNGYNSFNPTVAQIYRCKRQQISSTTTVATMNGWIDQAIASGQWLIEAYHGCDNEGYEPPPCISLAQHYAYVATKRSQIWNGTFNEVIKYIKERQTGSVKTVTSSAASIVLQLSDTLDNLIYNFPLTLKTEVNAAWLKVTVQQGGISLEKQPVAEAGISFVYYNAIPDNGDITLTNSSGTPVVRRAASGGRDVVFQPELSLYTVGGRSVRAAGFTAASGVHSSSRSRGLAPGIYIVKNGSAQSRFAVIP